MTAEARRLGAEGDLKFSLITVCYNSEKHIADALESVEAQTWRNLEHIVVDGQSRDDTMRIVREHEHPWRRVISEPDHGIYDAMNKGLRMATGDIVGFINSDDFYASPDVLETVALVMRDPAVEACYGDLCYVDPVRTSTVVRYWVSSPFKPGLFLEGWCPPHPTFFVRKSVLDKHGYFDLQYTIASDVEFTMRLLEARQVATRYIPRVLVRMRTGGASNHSFSSVWRQNVEIWRAMQTHGLRPSPIRFVFGKLMSRARQFLSRHRAA